MNAMTCQEVESQLDLLAAGECDPPLREALQAHLQQCPTCAARYAESQATIEQLNTKPTEPIS
jgi:anti-sigma factor RsiW